MGTRALCTAVLAGVGLLAQHVGAADDALMFGYEQNQLTSEAIGRVPSEHADLFAFDTTGPFLKSGECKVFPEDEGWPSESEWDALSKIVGEKALIKTVPLAAPCDPDWDVYDAEECKAVVRRWNSPYAHINDPTSVMWPIWEGMTCVPVEKGGSSGCTLGGYPVYVVNATSVLQIQAAVNFARNKGLRLVIKNTGHDFLGKSTGAGALSIWTQHLKQIDFIPEYTAGEYTGKAVHLGPGVRSLDADRVADENDASFVGGQCPSVGFGGGYVSGGGFSPLSSLFGMAADHVLAINIVTADGHYRTATAESHPDLFWAVRGGGGSTWGVVTSMVVRLHPRFPVTTSAISFETSATVSVETFWKGVRAYADHFERFADAGFYGYSNIRRNSARFNSSDLSLAVEPMMAANMTIETFEKVAKPFFDELTSLGIPYRAEHKQYVSYYEGFIDAWPDAQFIVSTPSDIQGSRLFPRDMWTDPSTLPTILASIRRVIDLGHDVTVFLYWAGNPFKVDNAVSPAARQALGYLSSGIPYPDDPTPEQLAAAREALHRDILTPWREIAPASKLGGAYLNDASPLEPFWQDDFFGSNYPRLLEVKRRWDANALFYAQTAVGSEEWEVRTEQQGIPTQNGRLCRIS